MTVTIGNKTLISKHNFQSHPHNSILGNLAQKMLPSVLTQNSTFTDRLRIDNHLTSRTGRISSHGKLNCTYRNGVRVDNRLEGMDGCYLQIAKFCQTGANSEQLTTRVFGTGEWEKTSPCYIYWVFRCWMP